MNKPYKEKVVQRLFKNEYNKSCQELAVYLLGKLFVRKLETGHILKGRIVETECYLGGEDKASHSFGGKVTKRNAAMYMPAGTVYVYSVYFGYHCLNISSIEPGAAVLIRALEPVLGTEIMYKQRALKSKGNITTSTISNGPSRLCMAMNITKENSNKLDLTDLNNDELWIENDSYDSFEIVNSKRIGIGSSAEEWATKPLRYYIFRNKSVSKLDKQAEKHLLGK